MSINDKIAKRTLFPSDCKYTYYSTKLFNLAVDNSDDPDILFKIRILGFYKKKYKWTNKQCDIVIKANLKASRGYYVGNTWYALDWGADKNLVATSDLRLYKMHLPELDHIKARVLFETNDPRKDDPKNFQILCKRLNAAKNDTNTLEEWIAIRQMADEHIKLFTE